MDFCKKAKEHRVSLLHIGTVVRSPFAAATYVHTGTNIEPPLCVTDGCERAVHLVSTERDFFVRILAFKFGLGTPPMTRIPSTVACVGSCGGHCCDRHDTDISGILTLLEPQSRFGDKPFKFQVVVPKMGLRS